MDCCSLAETHQIFHWCHAGMQLKHKSYELIYIANYYMGHGIHIHIEHTQNLLVCMRTPELFH